MNKKDLNKCKDFLDYFGVKWDGDKIKLTSEGNSVLLNPNIDEWLQEFLGYSVNGIARLVAKELDKEVYWDEEDY
jgi:hypothetical protein